MAEYTRDELLRAGKDLVELLIEKCNSTGNISGFLKDYLQNLTSDEGTYHQQQEAMNMFAYSSSQIHAEADTMMQASRKNSEQIKSICREFEGLNKTITEMQQRRQIMDENVEGLNKKIADITAFIKNIRDVSEQTNLLSFNASIEAARAGNAGKGFRIIANEVKNLSDRTTLLSNDIDEKVRELQDQLKAVLATNREHDSLMNIIQQTAITSNDTLLKINEDNETSSQFTERILNQINENQENIIEATRKAEEANIEQVRNIANRASDGTIHTGDELSFLYELRALFAYMTEHKGA